MLKKSEIRAKKDINDVVVAIEKLRKNKDVIGVLIHGEPLDRVSEILLDTIELMERMEENERLDSIELSKSGESEKSLSELQRELIAKLRKIKNS